MEIEREGRYEGVARHLGGRMGAALSWWNEGRNGKRKGGQGRGVARNLGGCMGGRTTRSSPYQAQGREGPREIQENALPTGQNFLLEKGAYLYYVFFSILIFLHR